MSTQPPITTNDWEKYRYNYKAKLVSVYDADTVTLLVDVGLGVYVEMTARLWGINAPEVTGPEKVDGLRARDWLIQRLESEEHLYIKTEKDRTGKYGRYIVHIMVPVSPGSENLTHISAQLVINGHAVYRTY